MKFKTLKPPYMVGVVLGVIRQHLGGGSVCSKVKDIGANNHYYIGGYYFFFTCYHYVLFYFNGLIEKGLALLIIPNYLLVHTL